MMQKDVADLLFLRTTTLKNADCIERYNSVETNVLLIAASARSLALAKMKTKTFMLLITFPSKPLMKKLYGNNTLNIY